ncbi:putative RING zinc finger protein; 84572-85321 [Arabidopsis thaliana]|uniref:Zinc finger RING-type n=2 Tax=Arabidopsis TaxID=3701 RepID=A0A8T2HKG6_ARASU|nr:RING/U-box superfamily protein [Arabidopsis thaliana]AAG52359.1 putative RING zinc finger protein; 84572-85321 [Arabidopsis thaliana]AEE35615.1 RING/U-box superfamily protein [Arabidopsis thaliana]KAG7659567.1 Zinc finger RING-type [Arabidopsis suecica]|eukprot:NP_177600.1 RING/U-box superfamily protein [Arabidopsis thaliana]
MGDANFDYSVSFRQDLTSPLTVELTCTNVVHKKIRLFTGETKTLSLPEQTIDHHTSFIPLNVSTPSTNTQNDLLFDIFRSPDQTTVISRPSKTSSNYSLSCVRISKILSSFGVTENGCSTILREIDMAITSSSSSSRGRGVVEIKIWKIKTEFYKANKAAENLLIDSYCYNYLNVATTEENGCAICMEDYIEGSSIVAKLPCDHEFHGDCINKWLQLNHMCPLCRSSIPKDVKSGYQSCLDSIFRCFGF